MEIERQKTLDTVEDCEDSEESEEEEDVPDDDEEQSEHEDTDKLTSELNVTNSLPEGKINNKFEVGDLNLAVMNVSGLSSKYMSVSNIVNNHDIRALVVSETYCCGKEIPFVNENMVAFYDNRNAGPNKGGVAIFLEKTLADHTVVIRKSASENEWVPVKCTYFHPPLVIVGVYGTNSSQQRALLQNTWEELWLFANKYREDNMLVVGGDLNCALGKGHGLTNNDPSKNTNGKIVSVIIKRDGWTVLNSKIRGNQISHINRGRGVNRCLDYITASNPAPLTRILMDDDMSMTPYRVVTKPSDSHTVNNIKADHRKFTDHKTILASFSLTKKEDVVIKPPPAIVVKDDCGDAKYFEFSEEVAEFTIDQLNEGVAPDKILKKVLRKIRKCERQSYTHIRRSKIKRKMFSDKEIFVRLTNNLEAQDKKMKNLKPNNKIWELRGKYLEKQRGEEVFSMFNSKGELIEERHGIFEALTEYNEGLLAREPHPKEFQDIHQRKLEIVKLLAETRIEQYESITPREYMRALEKIQAKNKRMFCQFFKLSFKMQAAFYFLFKAMYESEALAEEMLNTLLIALHKKGDPRDPRNYRFLHIKMDVARIFEMLVYFKLEQHFDTHTSECQQGGMKEGDTIENLAMLSSIIVDREDKKEGLVMTAVDAVKCFDRVHLSDAHAILQVAGADKKALKVLYKLGATNHIKVAGAKRSFTIINGETQGGITAARRTTYMIDEATLRYSKKIPEDMSVTHRGEVVNNEGFVDDELLLAFTVAAAALAASLYTLTLNKLAMSAHPTKTVQILAGDADWVTSVRKELGEKPST